MNFDRTKKLFMMSLILFTTIFKNLLHKKVNFPCIFVKIIKATPTDLNFTFKIFPKKAAIMNEDKFVVSAPNYYNKLFFLMQFKLNFL